MIYTCKAMIICLTGTAACSKECNLVILLCESDRRSARCLKQQEPVFPPYPSPPQPPGSPAHLLALLHPCALERVRVWPTHTPTPFFFWFFGLL